MKYIAHWERESSPKMSALTLLTPLPTERWTDRRSDKQLDL